MSLDPRQPVLVGIGTCMQREDSLSRSLEPMDLMLQATRLAGQDAGGAHTLAGVGRIAVPRGRWHYTNPAGEIARAIGAASATTVLAGVGLLQQSLMGDACCRIASGEIDSALVAGGDAGYRILRARQLGVRATERQQADAPDELLEPKDALLHPAELRAGIRMPAALYAILESAWRAKNQTPVDVHRRQLGAMYQRFSEVAQDNPHAWRRKSFTALEISEASNHNPMQAFPYTRLHCASWNVDQAAALLFCSVAKAQALGIAPAQWIYPLASVESNHMVPVSARADLTECVGARLTARAALDAADMEVSALDLIELYSCFPIAVEAYAQELGMTQSRDLTVTGGMPFAGGPFNNYVLQATCRMASLIREGRGRTGLVSSVSGILTKQGLGIWAAKRPATGFAFRDVSSETARLTKTTSVAQDFHGLGVVAGYTVLHDKNEAPRALVLADTASDSRALAWSDDQALVQQMESREFCGATIAMKGALFTPV